MFSKRIADLTVMDLTVLAHAKLLAIVLAALTVIFGIVVLVMVAMGAHYKIELQKLQREQAARAVVAEEVQRGTKRSTQR